MGSLQLPFNCKNTDLDGGAFNTCRCLTPGDQNINALLSAPVTIPPVKFFYQRNATELA